MDYCFPIVFGMFCNLGIPKQMQIFFQNRLWRFLKDEHLPIKLHSSPPGPKLYLICFSSVIYP